MDNESEVDNFNDAVFSDKYGKVADAIEALVKESDSLPCVSESDLSDSEFQLKRVYDWLMDENRKPAQTKFTAGWQRNLAKEIEYRLK